MSEQLEKEYGIPTDLDLLEYSFDCKLQVNKRSLEQLEKVPVPLANPMQVASLFEITNDHLNGISSNELYSPTEPVQFDNIDGCKSPFTPVKIDTIPTGHYSSYFKVDSNNSEEKNTPSTTLSPSPDQIEGNILQTNRQQLSNPNHQCQSCSPSKSPSSKIIQSKLKQPSSKFISHLEDYNIITEVSNQAKRLCTGPNTKLQTEKTKIPLIPSSLFNKDNDCTLNSPIRDLRNNASLIRQKELYNYGKGPQTQQFSLNIPSEMLSPDYKPPKLNSFITEKSSSAHHTPVKTSSYTRFTSSSFTTPRKSSLGHQSCNSSPLRSSPYVKW